MPGNITSANAVFMLSIGILFPVPAQLQGFAADNIFATDAVSSAEVSMGVDGIMSAGFVFSPTPQSISLQADSLSNDMFENWQGAQIVNRTIYRAQGIVTLPAVAKRYTCLNGVLTQYPPTPNAARTLQPRQYQITWERIIPSPA